MALDIKTIETCIEVAKASMSKQALKKFTHALRVKYCQQMIDEATEILNRRVCATQLRYDAKHQLDIYTAKLNNLLLANSTKRNKSVNSNKPSDNA